jgi:hypothetical protein
VQFTVLILSLQFRVPMACRLQQGRHDIRGVIIMNQPARSVSSWVSGC